MITEHTWRKFERDLMKREKIRLLSIGTVRPKPDNPISILKKNANGDWRITCG